VRRGSDHSWASASRSMPPASAFRHPISQPDTRAFRYQTGSPYSGTWLALASASEKTRVYDQKLRLRIPSLEAYGFPWSHLSSMPPTVMAMQRRSRAVGSALASRRYTVCTCSTGNVNELNVLSRGGGSLSIKGTVA
jgi:hypothetical protein